MRQLEANRINWPLWTAYIVENESWTNIYWDKEKLLEDYSIRLLDILDKEWEYKSPKADENQLELFSTLNF